MVDGKDFTEPSENIKNFRQNIGEEQFIAYK